ncbi:MAG: hypothetical protein JWP81_5212 [Ferruginibacter sp.]|nr:hypothetical protein [Ferruginibacter sp.]
MDGIRLKKLITISGGICSGKTYTANLISKKTDFPVASFGGYLKHYSTNNNLPIDRKSLQDMGEKFVQTSPQQFLKDVINYYAGNSDSVIIEGVRHISIFELINVLADKKIAIYVEADLQTRYNRYCNRSKDSDNFKTFEQFMLQDRHPVELETQSLKSKCNIIIDSTLPFAESIDLFSE